MPGMKKEHNWKMGNIHIAIAMPVNEVYSDKLPSEWMKNSEFGIHAGAAGQPDKGVEMRGAWASQGSRTKRNPRLGSPLAQCCPGLLTVLGETEPVRLPPPDCTAPAKRERSQFG